MLACGPRLTLAVLVLIAATGPQTGQASPPGAPVAATLRPYFGQLRTVQVMSGTHPLTLLLDTGGGQTLITPEAAAKVGCVPFGRSVGHRMSGDPVVFQRCDAVPLQLEGVTLDGPEVAVFDLMALLPPELPRLDGVLSLKSFNRLAVTIDFPDRLVLESVESAASRRSVMTPLTARLATGEDGNALTVFLAADAPRAPVWMLLDSGNLVGTMLSPGAATHLGLPPASIVTEGGTRFFDGLPIRIRGLEPIVERVTISDLIYDGALGASFMARGPIMIDLRDGHLWVGFQSRR